MPMPTSPFMETLRQHMLVRHYSKRSIDCYLYWVRYYIRFSGKRNPIETGSLLSRMRGSPALLYEQGLGTDGYSGV